MDYLVVDIDGTIANVRHRQHLAHVDWDAFHQGMMEDPPVRAVVELLTIYSHLEAKIIFLTGRPEKYRANTLKWLGEACGFFLEDDFLALLMRPELEFRSDVLIKPEILRDWMLDSKEPLEPDNSLFLDDRDAVVAMWRDLGYTCWQTATGAF